MGAALIYGVALATLAFLGLGLTRLILPQPFRADALIWSPFVGYTFMSIGFHVLNVGFLDGRRSAAILLVLALAALIASYVRRRSVPRADVRWLAGLAGLVTLSYFAGLAPLTSIGSLTAVGKNWDLIDIYDPTAAYVLDHPVSRIVSDSPPNPLALSVTSSSTLSNGWGLSYLHALVSFLSLRSPIETQAPVMSLMHALMIASIFIFCRRSLGLRAWLSLAISAAVACQALIVWTLLHGLGNHIAALAVLPLLFASTILALNTRKLTHIAFAAFMLTNLPLSYWAAFAFFVPPMLAYAVLGRPLRLSAAAVPSPVRSVFAPLFPQSMVRELWNGEPSMAALYPFPVFRFRMLLQRCGALLAIFCASIPLAAAGYQRILRTALFAWQNRHSTQPVLSQGFGDKVFLDISTLTGFSYWTWPAPKPLTDYFAGWLAQDVGTVEHLALLVGATLAGCALIRLPWRRKAILGSFVLAYGAELLYLRFVSEYYYAYLKAFTFAAPVFLALVGLGLFYWWSSGASLGRRLSRVTRTMAGAASVVLACIVALNGVLATAFYFNQPDTALSGSVLPPSSLALQQMVKLIPPGAPVFMTESPPLRPEIASPLAFFLKDHPLYGKIKTFESALNNPPPQGTVPDYGVLSASEDPADRGYSADGLIWSSPEVRLYRRTDTVAHYLFDGQSALVITPQQPLDLMMTESGLQVRGDGPAGVDQSAGARQLVLELGSLESQTVDVSVDGQMRELTLSPGLSRYGLESVTTPASISISSTAQSPVFVRSLNVLDRQDATTFLTAEHDVLMLAPSVDASSEPVHLAVHYVGADQFTDQLVLGVNVGGNMIGGQWNDLDWWGTDLRRSDIEMDLNLQTQQATARTDQQELHVNRTAGDMRDGDYTAMINVWNWSLAQTGWHSPFYELFKFSIRDGRVGPATVTAPAVVFLPMRSNFPVQPSAAEPYQGEIAQLQSHLPADAQVTISPSLLSKPQALGALTAGLTGVSVNADFLTGAQYVEPGHVYDYAILAADDDPTSFGYQTGKELWSGQDFKLYQRGSTLVHLDLKKANVYPELRPGQSYSFYPAADQVYTQDALQPSTMATGVERQVTVGLATLAATTISVQVDNAAPAQVSIPDGGMYWYRLRDLAVPGKVTVEAQGAEPVYLASIDLGTPSTQPPALIPNDDSLVMSVTATSPEPDILNLDVNWAGGGDPSRLFFLGVNAGGNPDKEGQWFSLGWWGVPMPGQHVIMGVNLLNRNAAASVDGVSLPVSSLGTPIRDANYDVSLSLWEKGLAARGWRTPFIDLAHFSSAGNQVQNLVPQSTELAIIPLLPAPAQQASAAQRT